MLVGVFRAFQSKHGQGHPLCDIAACSEFRAYCTCIRLGIEWRVIFGFGDEKSAVIVIVIVWCFSVELWFCEDRWGFGVWVGVWGFLGEEFWDYFWEEGIAEKFLWFLGERGEEGHVDSEMCMLGGEWRRGIGGGREPQWGGAMRGLGLGWGSGEGKGGAADESRRREEAQREGEVVGGGESGGGGWRAAGEAADGGSRGSGAQVHQVFGIRGGEVAGQCRQVQWRQGRGGDEEGACCGNCGADGGGQVARRDSPGQGARRRDHQCRLHTGRAAFNALLIPFLTLSMPPPLARSLPKGFCDQALSLLVITTTVLGLFWGCSAHKLMQVPNYDLDLPATFCNAQEHWRLCWATTLQISLIDPCLVTLQRFAILSVVLVDPSTLAYRAVNSRKLNPALEIR